MTSPSISLRAPFYPACPLCESGARLPVVEFPELAFVRCGACGLAYKSESVASLGVGYEEEYFRFNRAKYLQRWAHRVRKCRRQLVDCLQLAPQARVLCDVGCSAGYVLEAGRRLGLESIGVDVSRFAVELCRERGYRAELGSLEALPLPDASVDILTLKHTLEHVREPRQAMEEVRRVLRPGGVALVLVPDGDYWKLRYMPRKGRSFRPDRRGWQHHVYFSEENLAELCGRTGLEVVHRGKAVFRPAARGWAAAFERLRFGWMWLYTWFGKATRLRREMQLFARKPTA